MLRQQWEFISPPDLEIHFDKVNKAGELGQETCRAKRLLVAIRTRWRSEFSLAFGRKVDHSS